MEKCEGFTGFTSGAECRRQQGLYSNSERGTSRLMILSDQCKDVSDVLLHNELMLTFKSDTLQQSEAGCSVLKSITVNQSTIVYMDISDKIKKSLLFSR